MIVGLRSIRDYIGQWHFKVGKLLFGYGTGFRIPTHPEHTNRHDTESARIRGEFNITRARVRRSPYDPTTAFPGTEAPTGFPFPTTTGARLRAIPSEGIV